MKRFSEPCSRPSQDTKSSASLTTTAALFALSGSKASRQGSELHISSTTARRQTQVPQGFRSISLEYCSASVWLPSRVWTCHQWTSWSSSQHLFGSIQPPIMAVSSNTRTTSRQISLHGKLRRMPAGLGRSISPLTSTSAQRARRHVSTNQLPCELKRSKLQEDE